MLASIRTSPRPLLVYLGLICVANLALWPVALLTSERFLRDPVTLVTCAALIALSAAAERVYVKVTDAKAVMTLASAVWIASILLLPPILPFLISLLALALAYGRNDSFPTRARLFNITHTPLSVAGASVVAGSFGSLSSMMMGPQFPHAILCLAAVIATFYFLEQGKLLLVIALASRQQLWRILRDDIASTAPYELGVAASGVLLTIAWEMNPLYILFFVLPVVALKKTLRMVDIDKHAQATRRHASHLRTAATTAAQLRLHDASEGEMFSPFLAAAQKVTGATNVALYLTAGELGLRRIAILEPHADIADLLIEPLKPGLTEVKEESGTIIALPTEEASTTPAASESYMATVGLLSDEGQQPRGALRLVGMPRVLEDEEQDSLGLLGLLIEAALENTARYQERAQQAMTDGLTGLGNRGAFDERLSLEAARAQGAGGQPLGLLCIDLDHFKGINDAYGHEAGDTVLVAVAQTLMATVRGTDLACRPGGDEFAVILPRTSEEEAREVAQRACVALNGLVVMHEGVGIRVGASVGIAVLPEHARTGEGLYRAADRAAYNAKKAGRGCVSDPAGILAA